MGETSAVRIIAGSLRGRSIRAPRGLSLRPTSDRVREALSDLLQARIPGAAFLDLFAGAGGVGIEALSRGASRAVFVERSPIAVRYIRENLAEHRLEQKARVFPVDAIAFLSKPPAGEGPFDIVFMDPPYGSGLLRKALPRVAASDMIKADSWIIAEHHHKQGMDEEVGSLRLFRQSRYGETILSFYSKAPA